MKIKNDNLKSIEYKTNTYFLKWYMTSWCNYHCPYCIQYKQGVKISQEEIQVNAEHINNMLIRNNISKPLFLKLIGGECTIYDLIPVLDKFTVNIKNITLTTNFFRSNTYFKDLYTYCKSRNITLILCLSKHDENKNFYEKALELTEWCRENGFKDPEISIVAPFDLEENELTKYMELGLKRIKVCPAREQFSDIAYELNEVEKEFIKRIEANNPYIPAQGNYIFTYYDGTVDRRRSVSDYVTYFDHGGFIPDGRFCSVGLNSIAIKPEGDIYRGGCTFTNNIFNADLNRLGWITDENFKLPTEPILCKTNSANYAKGKLLCCLPCDHVSVGERVDEKLYNIAIEKEKINENR